MAGKYSDTFLRRNIQPVRRLGSGSFGVARLVRLPNGDQFCQKEVVVHDPKERELILTEIKALQGSAGHPNVVGFVTSWALCNRVCILMEFCPNGSLSDHIKRVSARGRKFSSIKVQSYMEDMANGIEYLHKTLLTMHRDIKPDNILMDGEGVLKLADFGWAKETKPGNPMTRTMAGTPLFNPPEQYRGEYYSFSTDIWALGCVIFEIMTFHSPWKDCVDMHSLSKCVQQGADFAPLMERSYPPNLVSVVRWMMQTDPSLRPEAGQLIHHITFGIPSPLDTAPRGENDPEGNTEQTGAKMLLATSKIQTVLRQSFERRKPALLLTPKPPGEMLFDKDHVSPRAKAGNSREKAKHAPSPSPADVLPAPTHRAAPTIIKPPAARVHLFHAKPPVPHSNFKLHTKPLPPSGTPQSSPHARINAARVHGTAEESGTPRRAPVPSEAARKKAEAVLRSSLTRYRERAKRIAPTPARLQRLAEPKNPRGVSIVAPRVAWM